ncbi:GNAT family N-acetyltransferase [Intrasporangium sp. YIM S08009]|uniref:GNAT family N-acetyltransferase n=1 Tax=Intrasporangium zincisolvens TaxID=3080018 RepID=UPI002B0543C3|nr:GNAT family N-acetyltransferase [Intrasporangium sp. YIM S08009]
MDLRPLDLTDDAALTQAYDVECAALQAVRRGWVPLGAKARIAAWQTPGGWRTSLVGAFDGDALLGFASSATADDTPDTTWVDVYVHPDHQRRGLGSQLARAAEVASPDAVERFVASAYLPTPAAVDSLVEGFAAGLGYARATDETVVELDLDSAHMSESVALQGYTVSTHVDGVPESLRREVGVVKGLVDAEAPNGDLAWEPTPVSEEEYAEEIALWTVQGRTAVEAVALDGDGTVAAWTCLLLPAADSPRAAQVVGTLVLGSHRGHGLGRAVKVASLRAARERRAGLRVRTSSDNQNVWMHAINRELGFVPVESEVVLQKRLRP